MTVLNSWLEFGGKVHASLSKFRTIYLPLHGPHSSKVALTGLALVARTTSNFESVLILAHAGKTVEARTMTRSCLENLYFLGGLIVDGEKLVDQMCDHDKLRRDERGQFIFERGLPVQEDVEEKLRSFLRDGKADRERIKGL